MILTSIDSIPGKEIVEVYGLVKGSTIRAKHIGKDIIAGLRNVVGGEIKEYSEMLNEGRSQAISRMVREAEALGANAVIGVRFSTSQVMSMAAEIMVYGTAVRVE